MNQHGQDHSDRGLANEKIARRDFMRIASAAALMPAVLPWELSQLIGAEKSRPRALVIVELDGGNDGLSTVVPFADDRLYRARPTLAPRPEDVLRLDDHHGLAPPLKSLEKLVDAGRLAVVNNVGYPVPDRSHFRSMDIWQSGVPDRVDDRTGWLGRALARAGRDDEARIPSLFAVGKGPVPLLFAGAPRPVIALESLADLAPRGGPEQRRLAMLPGPEIDDSFADLARATRDVATKLDRAARAAQSRRGEWPSSPLAKSLATCASLVQGGFADGVFHVRLSGFDTHARQREIQPILLEVYAKAVAAFFDELSRAGLADDVILVTFSEFGRRVRENAGGGTDHGAANCVMIMGGGVEAGVHGGKPDLENLLDGDLVAKVDLRAVYAKLLEGWLGVAPETFQSELAGAPDLLAKSSRNAREK